MDHNKLIDQCHSAAKKNGWWDESRPHEEIILLIKSELFEAMDAYRSDKRASKDDIPYILSFGDNSAVPLIFESRVKDTFEDEIADTAIRIFDYLGFLGIDLKLNPFAQAYKGGFMKMLECLDAKLAWLLGHVGREKENIVFELSECLLTLEELAKTYDFDLHTHIQLKLRYNATRGKKHGKKF